jgi:hypothetical protein
VLTGPNPIVVAILVVQIPGHPLPLSLHFLVIRVFVKPQLRVRICHSPHVLRRIALRKSRPCLQGYIRPTGAKPAVSGVTVGVREGVVGIVDNRIVPVNIEALSTPSTKRGPEEESDGEIPTVRYRSKNSDVLEELSYSETIEFFSVIIRSSYCTLRTGHEDFHREVSSGGS